MVINTKEIKKGIVTVDGKPIRIGMDAEELKDIFGEACSFKNKSDEELRGAGHASGVPLEEDGFPVEIYTWFSNGKVSSFNINIITKYNEDKIYDYEEIWTKERNLEWYGKNYYATDGGVIEIIATRFFMSDKLDLAIKISDEEPPVAKFPKTLSPSAKEVCYKKDDKEYYFQKVTKDELEGLDLMNVFGEGPMSLYLVSDWNKDNRFEIIYIAISEGKGENKNVIGVAEFMYMAVGEAYEDGEIFIVLDEISQALCYMGAFLDRYEEDITVYDETSKVTPYILYFNAMHNELPHNKEIDVFIEDEESFKAFLGAATEIVADYVDVPESDITNIDVLDEADEAYPYHENMLGINISYGRLKK